MAKYYITTHVHAPNTKKGQKIRELVEGYNGALVNSEQTIHHIARDVEDFVNDFNEMYRGKQNHTHMQSIGKGNILLSIHTDGTDATSGLCFNLVTHERG